ncbi:LPXTG cell wall anchor domain-containing protein [Streptomyces sp. NPDC055189]
MSVGVGYIASEPQKSNWIIALGAALLVAGGFIFRRFLKKMRDYRNVPR